MTNRLPTTMAPLFSLLNIYWSAVIVAATVAETVLTIIKRCPNLAGVSCCKQEKKILHSHSFVMKKSQPSLPETSSDSSSSFFTYVWEVVRQIPAGRVTSYGAIANYLGTKLSARMVGWAMNASHTAQPPVPAQRVVNRLGMLSGKAHFDPPTFMQEALEKEGVVVENDAVKDFDKRFWDPAIELGL